MSSISSISSAIQPAATVRACQSNFDVNVQAYGSAAASVIGLADVVGDSASAIVSFSAESLEKLGDAVEAGFDVVGEALSDAGDVVSETVETIEADLSAAASSVSDAASSVGNGISSAASSVANGISSAASSTAAYVAMGLAAGKQAISEII